MGLPRHEREAISRTIGLALPEAFVSLTGLADPDLGRRFLDLFLAKADEIMTEGTHLYPDTVSVLRQLRDAGLKTGIVSTKFHYRLEAIIDRYDLGNYLAILVGGDDVRQTKPHPEALLLAMERLNVCPEHVLYVGDSLIDAQAAQSAAVAFIAVTTGTTTAADFLPYPHLSVLAGLADLLPLVLSERDGRRASRAASRLPVVETDRDHPDFIALCGLLEQDLDERAGGACNRGQYAPHNQLDAIERAFLIYEQAVPVACAAIRPFGATAAEVKRVFVRPEWRGQGLSRSLMQALEDYASRQGYTSLILETGAVLKAALGLYRSLGYTPIERYGPYVCMADSICLGKDLSGAR
jgi:phosphoglycolate phosphatase